MKRTAWISQGCLFLLPTTQAASFGCEKSSSKMEKLICSDPQLSRSDEDLAAAYAATLKEASDPAVIKQQQREWLADVRKRCDDVACISDAYASRIIQLTLGKNASTQDATSVAANPEDGIWAGTIGEQQVMACFKHEDNPKDTKAAYFYLHSPTLKRIALFPRPEESNVWLEENLNSPKGIWTVTERPTDLLNGKWSDATGSHILLIRLKRFKSLSLGDPTSYNPGCEPEFSVFDVTKNSLIEKDKIFVSEILKRDGKQYRVLSALDGAVSTLELIDKSEAREELNERLKNELKDQMSGYYECKRFSRDSAEGKPDFKESVELAFWNSRWISFKQVSSSDCGGAYPNSSFSYSTWDLTTGKKVNLWAWIKNSINNKATPHNDNHYFNYHAPDQLNKIISTKAIKQRIAFNPNEAKEENNCLNTIELNAEYQLSLGKNGLVFSSTFPHVAQACDDNIEIPYNTLLPFMTKEGKDAVKLIN